MFALKRSTIRCHYLSRSLETNQFLSAQPQTKSNSDEYTDKPEYPEILELSREARMKREKQSWHEQIKAVPTIEEKLIKINMPRYYGFKTIMLNSEENPYNCLPLNQHYTRTVFEGYEKLPNTATNKDEASKTQMESFVKSVSANIQDAIEYSNEFFKERYGYDSSLSAQQKDKLLGQIIVENLNRTLINSLSADAAHLSEIEIDLNPRHEAFWSVGGVNPSKDVVKSRKGRDWQKDTVDMPVDRLVQYTGEPYLAIRHSLPLAPIKSIEESTSEELAKKVPLYKFDARTLGYKTDYRHATNIPGHWPGSSSGFGLISFHPRDHLLARNPNYGPQDFEEVLHAQGIQSSFGWLLAQANYNGFNTYNDLTYPMTTQTVITNGKQWSFYRYQLNTTLIHSDHVHDNPKVNFCWGSKEANLFAEIDSTGKCLGFNDDVARNLIELYLNAPVEQQTQLQPYLSKEEQKIADIDDQDRREFLEHIFKHLTSNRPRHLEIPEIYLWERIYKIDNKTRRMEPKRRFFELDINPWRRTLDQHAKEYIPKAVRPGGPKSKPRFKKTYYP
ncbi:28S ribosomal protein S30, mitochondrial [Episyrphus balteatus]|uniref:28S ribosomal protein S30, mitochondrial n=1 Tax=Episyrphus balteatus TaxID=286459 RepID=UPI00248540F9|nr:28S ribosomal protein S30, mitochondrial [Episyrphus balteatus]